MIHLYLTGASRGIGAAMAKASWDHADVFCDGFSRNGLTTDGRPKDGLTPLEPKRGVERNANPLADVELGYRDQRLDLSDMAVLERFVFPDPHPDARLLVLVNNAGTLEPLDRVGKHMPHAVDHAVRLNLTAPMLLSNAFVRQFGRHEATKLIVHVSSGAAQSPYAGWSVYCATKAGLDMLTRVQALEFDGAAAAATDASAGGTVFSREAGTGPGRFHVRSMAPGVVETGMQEMLREAEPDAFPRKAKFVALHREGQLSDADAVGRAYLEQFKAFAEGGEQAIPELISRLPQLPA